MTLPIDPAAQGPILVALLVVVAFFTCIGIISTMRWTSRHLRGRRTAARVKRWAHAPRISRPHAVTPAQPTPPTGTWTPFRDEPGPRDWEQRL